MQAENRVVKLRRLTPSATSEMRWKRVGDDRVQAADCETRLVRVDTEPTRLVISDDSARRRNQCGDKWHARSAENLDDHKHTLSPVRNKRRQRKSHFYSMKFFFNNMYKQAGLDRNLR